METILNLLKKISIALSIIVLFTLLFNVVLRPTLVSLSINKATKYTSNQYICSIDENGQHIAKLYKLKNGKKFLQKTHTSNSCIFSRPKSNIGYFILIVGGGGGATPYENGKNGEVLSKHFWHLKPITILKVGQGGNGTYINKNGNFIDSKDGEKSIVEDLKLIALGGEKSNRMTPTNNKTNKIVTTSIPEKYQQLYHLKKTTKYGLGGKHKSKTQNISAKSQNGNAGVIIIQW